MKNTIIIITTLITCLFSQIPERRIVAEWEPAIGTMIRWPLGIPSDLVVELASDDIIYVLVESTNEQNQATNNFNNWGVNFDNVIFINTDTYSHWTRDHGPQFLIGEDYWKVVNQEFNGYPVENGCINECDEDMIMLDCIGTEFCNNQPLYASDGYDCYVNNELCEDFNGDGQILDWLGDGYCDDGTWGLDFSCEEYSWDCTDCGAPLNDVNGYCDDSALMTNRNQSDGRPMPNESRGWEEDDDTNIDFANQLNWDVYNLPLYFTGGNFMTDGYGMGFSTQLMVNENNISNEDFLTQVNQQLYLDNYHILDNPNEESIQHIDCMAKLVNPETIIIKQVPESSLEYDCMEDFAQSFYNLNTFYDRPFNIHRIFCPEINGGFWEINPVAAYTNSLILNNKVLVPQYGIPEDNDALQVYIDAMPGYQVIGFDGANSNPWFAEDALHCRTMGVFNPDMLHISHKSIRTNGLNNNNFILIEAEIIDYSENINFELEVLAFWKYSENDGPFSSIALEYVSDNHYNGTFPNFNSNSEIEYFITATNLYGNSVSHPFTGWHTFETLDFVLGDVNMDNSINIIDILLTVNLILNNQFNNLADLNADEVINVLDIIELVNIILE